MKWILYLCMLFMLSLLGYCIWDYVSCAKYEKQMVHHPTMLVGKMLVLAHDSMDDVCVERK